MTGSSGRSVMGTASPETSELQVHVNPLRSCEIHGKQRTKWGWQRCPREKATMVDLWELGGGEEGTGEEGQRAWQDTEQQHVGTG